MFTIRLYDERDSPTVLGYICDLLAYEQQIDSGRASGNLIAQSYLTYLLDKCEQTDGAILVLDTKTSELDIGGYICVFANYNSESMIDTHPVYAYIPDFYVHPNYRGVGAGKALLTAAEQWVKFRGASTLKLSVLAGNLEARAFYGKSGFSEHEIQLQKSLILQSTSEITKP
jgi:GNAT superfamily N-acetyltransferase